MRILLTMPFIGFFFFFWEGNAFYCWVYIVKFFKIKNYKTLFKIDYLCHNINMKWLDILPMKLNYLWRIDFCILASVWIPMKKKIISLFSLFLLLFIGSTALFDTIYSPTVLFHLTFTFIYSIFNNKFSVSAK